MVAPSTSTVGSIRSVRLPTRVCRVSWMDEGVSGSPVTIHSEPEVKTCRCRPEKTPRIAFAWSDTRAKSIPSSSSPAPGSKSKLAAVRDRNSRFGRSRVPPITRRC